MRIIRKRIIKRRIRSADAPNLLNAHSRHLNVATMESLLESAGRSANSCLACRKARKRCVGFDVLAGRACDRCIKRECACMFGEHRKRGRPAGLRREPHVAADNRGGRAGRPWFNAQQAPSTSSALWDAPLRGDTHNESVPASSAEASPVSSAADAPREQPPLTPPLIPGGMAENYDFGLVVPTVPATATVVQFARAAPQPDVRRSTGVQTDGPVPLVVCRPEPLRPSVAPPLSSVAAAHDISRRLQLFLATGVPA